MAKQTVYLETTVIGHLTGRMHSDPVIAGRQTVTREWWNTAAQHYRLLASQLVIDECSAGDAEAAAERLAAIQGIDLIQNSTQTESRASLLIQRGAVPTSEPRDALHISLAAVNGVEYLLTWNFKHIANATTRDLIEQTCVAAGYEPPLICTPDELAGE